MDSDILTCGRGEKLAEKVKTGKFLPSIDVFLWLLKFIYITRKMGTLCIAWNTCESLEI